MVFTYFLLIPQPHWNVNATDTLCVCSHTIVYLFFIQEYAMQLRMTKIFYIKSF